MGTGCGSVGRVVASDTRDPWLASVGWQILLANRTIQTTNIKKKRPGIAHLLKKHVAEILLELEALLCQFQKPEPDLLAGKPCRRKRSKIKKNPRK